MLPCHVPFDAGERFGVRLDSSNQSKSDLQDAIAFILMLEDEQREQHSELPWNLQPPTNVMQHTDTSLQFLKKSPEISKLLF